MQHAGAHGDKCQQDCRKTWAQRQIPVSGGGGRRLGDGRLKPEIDDDLDESLAGETRHLDIENQFEQKVKNAQLQKRDEKRPGKPEQRALILHLQIAPHQFEQQIAGSIRWRGRGRRCLKKGACTAAPTPEDDGGPLVTQVRLIGRSAGC
jgi:hypothetical protein